MGRKIDIRIMNLNKWYIPKSFSVDKLKDPVVLGYFDALQIREIRIDQEKLHPFMAGYRQQDEEKNNEKNDLVDYSSQEQMLFLSICQEGEEEDGVRFKEDTVNQFWKDQTYPYTFLSMIHINHAGKLGEALHTIRKVFGKNYLAYISFDYCDIVLFSHNKIINEFMYQIKRLFEVEKEEAAVIFDTFSMICFQPELINNRVLEQCDKPCEKDNAKFQATINLSIRNYKKFSHWYTELINLNGNIVRYNMFGRHDISIVNEEADTAWLMQIMNMLHRKDSKEIFWTFETFIKIKDEKEVEMMPGEPGYLEKVYKYVKENLDKEILGNAEAEGLKDIISKSNFRDNGRYLLPIYEVRDCICSIVKNSFAEEFIYCIYESFLHFISYMKKEITHMIEVKENPISCERKISKVYDSYFTALNTLVNSTMHNDRQFVQATAFNAVFYSVPPKIMAFYNAYIYRIKQILRDAKCKEEYTFLIYPSFSPLIFVEQISLDDNLPADRLLTVRISEKSLYDIESVMYQLVHELAHYVGNSLRCRQVRKQKIIDSLVKYIVAECGINEETYQALSAFVQKNIPIYNRECDKNEQSEWLNYNYLKYIELMGRRLIQMLEHDQGRWDLFQKYYQDKINKGEPLYDELLEDLGVEEENQKNYIINLFPNYCTLKSVALREKIEKFNSEEQITYYEMYIGLIKSVYSESYADLQMILILAMDVESYLNTFFVKQNVPEADLLSDMESMLRISTIYRVMKDCGIWKRCVHSQKSKFAEIIEYIEAYSREVEEGMNEKERAESEKKKQSIKQLFEQYNFTNGIPFKPFVPEQQGKQKQSHTDVKNIHLYVDAAIGLYEYLLEVMEESLKEYTLLAKQAMISEVRTVVKNILTFKDTADVFNCIEEELRHYKKEGCKITPV